MPDSTPKPIQLVKGHRTKAEIEAREKSEKSLMTGIVFKEWPDVKADPIAHKQFSRLKRLYRSIGRDDAMIESVINRYCMLLSECNKFELEDKRLRELAGELDDRKTDLEFNDYFRMAVEIGKQIQKNDSLLQLKRKMLLDIEKENVMTLVSAMRSIPKKPSPETEFDPMAKLLGGG